MTQQDTTEMVYSYIEKYQQENGGVSPSQREIGRACFLAQSSVRYHLAKLQGLGRIAYGKGKARHIVLLN